MNDIGKPNLVQLLNLLEHQSTVEQMKMLEKLITILCCKMGTRKSAQLMAEGISKQVRKRIIDYWEGSS